MKANMWMKGVIFIHHCESFKHSQCDWLNHDMWYGHHTTWYGHCHLVCIDQVMCDCLNHTTWFHSNRYNQCCPEAWNLSQYCFICFTQYIDANMLCRLYDDHKYMDIYLLIHQEYCYLKHQFVFFPINL